MLVRIREKGIYKEGGGWRKLCWYNDQRKGFRSWRGVGDGGRKGDVKN